MQLAIAIVGGSGLACLAALSLIPRKTEMMDVFLVIGALVSYILLFVLALWK